MRKRIRQTLVRTGAMLLAVLTIITLAVTPAFADDTPSKLYPNAPTDENNKVIDPIADDRTGEVSNPHSFVEGETRMLHRKIWVLDRFRDDIGDPDTSSIAQAIDRARLYSSCCGLSYGAGSPAGGSIAGYCLDKTKPPEI